MAARLSTGLVTALMGSSNFRTLFALGFIDIYSGTQPTLPDNVPNGTLLCTLYSDGTTTGLSWSPTAPDGVLSNLSSQTWSGTVLATGTAGWFRLRAVGDTGVLSTTQCRFDGAIATSGVEMNLGNLSLLLGAPFVITAASFTLPQQ
jgi:hypothetical protein